MADRLTRAERSALMSRIRGDDLKPEARLRAALRAAGVRFRRNARGLPGTPDVVLDAARLAVFVDGCFWHGCPRHCRMPKTRRRFWEAKFEVNRRRDARVRRALNRAGWSVMRVWEHDLRTAVRVERVVTRIKRRNNHATK